MGEHRFGIIGCGMISEYHAAAIQELKNARLAAVSSRSEQNAKKLTGKYGVPWYREPDELIRQRDIDIISICTPSGAHMEPAIAAAKSGKHVVVEKPLEVTLERTDRMIQACRKNNVTLCAIFPSRFSESVQVLKSAIDEGRFGTLTLADCYNKWWRSQEYYDSGGWRGTWELDGGGACMNQAIHAIDLLQWLMGPVDRITAETDTRSHERIKVEDTAAAVLRFKNRAIGVIEATTSVYPGHKRRIEIHGDRGSVIMEDSSFVLWEFADKRDEDDGIRRKFAPRDTVARGAADPRSITHDNHRKQLQNLVDTLDSKAELMVDGAEGRKAIEIILGIYHSSRTGRPVTLPLTEGD